MNEKEIQLKSEVMKRVKTVHYMRVTIRPFLVRIGFLVISVVGGFSLISVPDVIRNLITYKGNQFTYLLDAFAHTSVSVQMVLVIISTLLIWVLFDILKNLKGMQTLKFN